MGIWLELGVFGLVFVFAFWQMHDVRKAQALTRQQRAREKAQQEALDDAASHFAQETLEEACPPQATTRQTTAAQPHGSGTATDRVV